MEQNYWEKNHKKALKAYRKHIDVFVRAMKAYPERISEAAFLKETEDQFVALLPKLPLHPGSKAHLFNELMPALGTISAAYRVLKAHGYTAKQIGRLEYEGYLALFGKIPRPIRGLARRVMVSPLFSRLMRKNTRKMTESGRADTFFIEYAFQKRPCRATHMTCTQCGMIAFMEKNDLEEMKGFCNAFDFAQAEAFGLGLRQSSCIGQGDDTCRYVFTANKNDTVLPENIVAIRNVSMDV